MRSDIRRVTFSLKDIARKRVVTAHSVEQQAAITLLDLEKLPPDLQQKFMSADSCSAVYHACGSCDAAGKPGAWVDFYCGDGGSAPDYSVCEAC